MTHFNRMALAEHVVKLASGLVVCAALGAAGGALAQAPSSWQVVGVQGLVQFVIVPPGRERDAAAYRAEIAKLCPAQKTCFVNFYSNSSGQKAELPLPDAIAAEATARFRRSTKNGVEQFQWSCRLGVQGSEGQCF